jgi:hypothetical protein
MLHSVRFCSHVFIKLDHRGCSVRDRSIPVPAKIFCFAVGIILTPLSLHIHRTSDFRAVGLDRFRHDLQDSRPISRPVLKRKRRQLVLSWRHAHAHPQWEEASPLFLRRRASGRVGYRTRQSGSEVSHRSASRFQHSQLQRCTQHQQRNRRANLRHVCSGSAGLRGK